MSENLYAFAVARIRALESDLLDKEFYEQLLTAKDYKTCVRMLIDKGWGNGKDSEDDVEAMLSFEKNKTWSEVYDLIDDKDSLEVLSYPDLYHNLKAAVKDALIQGYARRAYIPGTVPSGDEMRKLVLAQDYQALPSNLSEVAKEAYETLLHTRDGQLCDIIVDKATLETIYNAGMNSEESVIRDYAVTTVDIANIKIAIRAQRTRKNADFYRQALVATESFNPEEVIKAALAGEDSLYEYLKNSPYAEAVEVLQESSSAFECWCDNQVIDSLRPQLYKAFTMGPVVAYAIARDMEIKTVRIILTGKLNDFSEEAIRERMRETYV